MANSETNPQNEGNELATLVAVYPLAFALAAASNSRAGLALRGFAPAGLNAPTLLHEFVLEPHSAGPGMERGEKGIAGAEHDQMRRATRKTKADL